jgi:hypothetical protein
MFNVLQFVLDTISVTRPATQYVMQTGSRTERSQHLNPPTSYIGSRPTLSQGFGQAYTTVV